MSNQFNRTSRFFVNGVESFLHNSKITLYIFLSKLFMQVFIYN